MRWSACKICARKSGLSCALSIMPPGCSTSSRWDCCASCSISEVAPKHHPHIGSKM
ncbi:Uncharacterised protein [Vibrio cholerae]|nr:Uncharacterised protein [Vibrio cholerae]CSH90952.1 Uncharacterised protein [Vibrio cholerae]CSI67000.1 Uncharacterised protein [Vibrio cholerae]